MARQRKRRSNASSERLDSLYYKGQSTPDAKKQKRSRTLRQRFKTAQSSQITRLALVAGVVIVVLVVFAQSLPIRSVDVHINDSQSFDETELDDAQKRIQASVDDFLNTHFSSRFKPFLDDSGLQQFVIDEQSDVLEVSTDTGLFSSVLNVAVELRQPILLLESRGQFYRIDQTGVAFATASSDEAELIKMRDEGGVAIEVGQQVLQRQQVEFIEDIKFALSLEGRLIQEVILPQSLRELDLRLGDTPYRIKFTTEHELDEQLTALKQVETFLRSNQITPAAYIDLRVPERAFYQ